ncbi:hypothetical protein FRB95_011740 [Tulasnella sp. JGI-2019a]|nr:hypothetical protein FRB95_011740 [Tulasnella sp. JGI-2019a]
MGGEECIIYVYVMDETLTSLSARAPINISTWYPDDQPLIRAATFFPGKEELCIIEHSGCARIYSFLSRAFRPGTVHLPPSFDYVQSTHDAAALLVVQDAEEGVRKLWIYHRSSFESRKNEPNIALDLPTQFSRAASFSVSSFSQQNISLLALLPLRQAVQSVSLEISRQGAEYAFRAKGEKPAASKFVEAQHNCLIDCFAEVWRRYPIVSAIKRETISADGRQQQAISFVTEDVQAPYKR